MKKTASKLSLAIVIMLTVAVLFTLLMINVTADTEVAEVREDGSGNLCYYVNDILQKGNPGLIEIEGYFYYVNYSGKVAVNTNATVKAETSNGLANPGTYYFGADGKCANLVEKGFTGVRGGKYYEDGVLQKGNPGLVEVEGYFYYVNYNGTVKVSTNATIKAETSNGLANPGTYYFDADGKCTNLVEIGFTGVRGGKYYEDGVLQKGNPGLVEVEGYFYYVNYNGTVKVSTNATVKVETSNGLANPGTYYFDADGKCTNLVEMEYTGIRGGKYYINGVLQKGNERLFELGGETYYVRHSGAIATNTSVRITDTRGNGGAGITEGICAFDENGYLTETKPITYTGVVVDKFFIDGSWQSDVAISDVAEVNDYEELSAAIGKEYIVLLRDIYASPHKAAFESDFTGTLLGNGKTIYMLGKPLFANINGGKVENLTIENSSITASADAGFIAVLVTGDGAVKNVTVGKNCSILAPDGVTYVGGIVSSLNRGTIENCTNYASIVSTASSSTTYVGGIASVCGKNDTGSNTVAVSTIKGCTNYGQISLTGKNTSAYLAGITGYLCGGKVTDCANYGDVFASGAYAVGIAGYVYRYALIEKCINAGDMNGNARAVGILGYTNGNYNGGVDNCVNIGTVSGTGILASIATVKDVAVKKYTNCLWLNQAGVNALYKTGTQTITGSGYDTYEELFAAMDAKSAFTGKFELVKQGDDPATGIAPVNCGHILGTLTDCTYGRPCKVCGISLTEPTSHTEVVTIEAVAATCTDDGATKESNCSVCGMTLSTVTTIEALGHQWREGGDENGWIDEGAELVRYCERPGCETVEHQPKCPHENTTSVVTPATCTEDGYTTYTCQDCEYVWVADETVALGHDYQVTDNTATCLTAGVKTSICSRCNDIITEDCEALGHDVVNNICNNAVEVSTLAELTEALANNCCVRLMADIDASELDTSYAAYGYYFDGNGCEISGLSVPLFVSINGGKVVNLTIADSAISTAETNVGFLAKTTTDAYISKVTIASDCSITTTCTATCYIGGIVGSATRTEINYSKNYSSITANNANCQTFIGGIAGLITNSISGTDFTNVLAISYCENYGSMTLALTSGAGSKDSKVAGIVGSTRDAKVEYCANYGNITSNDNGQTAGILAWMQSYSYAAYCVNGGTVSGAKGTSSGIVAYCNGNVKGSTDRRQRQILNNVNYGDVTASDGANCVAIVNAKGYGTITGNKWLNNVTKGVDGTMTNITNTNNTTVESIGELVDGVVFDLSENEEDIVIIGIND